MPARGESTPVEAVAPWWHTLLILVVLGLTSWQSAIHHGLPGFAIPGLDERVSRYLSVLAGEWIVILFIWLAIKPRGISMRDLIGGRWQTAGSFFKDLGLGCAALVAGILVIGALTHLLGSKATDDTIKSFLPRTLPELAVWVLLSTTAGFCEEFIFRGYLMRQFGAWSKSWVAGVILQGVAFGLSHGYYLRAMIAIVAFGWLLGLLAHWRQSLRPGMVAHAMQDTLGGVFGYFTAR